MLNPKNDEAYTHKGTDPPVRFEDCKSFNARTAIGKTKMEDIKKWRADNLLPNPSIKRMNVLKKVN